MQGAALYTLFSLWENYLFRMGHALMTKYDPQQERIMTPEKTERFIAWIDNKLSEARLTE